MHECGSDPRLGSDAIVLTKWSFIKRGYAAFVVSVIGSAVLVPFLGFSLIVSLWTAGIAIGFVTSVALVVQPVVWVDVRARDLRKGIFIGNLLVRWHRSELARSGNVYILKKYNGPARSKVGWYGGVRLRTGRVYWFSYGRHRRFVMDDLARLVPLEDSDR